MQIPRQSLPKPYKQEEDQMSLMPTLSMDFQGPSITVPPKVRINCLHALSSNVIYIYRKEIIDDFFFF